MSALNGWAPGRHTADGVTHPTWRRGSGPGVVVIHEVPGITPEVQRFAEEVIEAGHTVVMPQLFGTPGVPMTPAGLSKVLPRVCVSREFHTLARGRTSPVADWLRSLARGLHAELGGPGVGVVGMCLTGGLALAVMVEKSVAAPVVCQPSLPFAVGARRSADLEMSPADLDVVRRRASAGCSVLGLRYRGDPATGTRFETLRRELGDAFVAVELDGEGHSTVTAHRQEAAVHRVLQFLADRLAAGTAGAGRC